MSVPEAQNGHLATYSLPLRSRSISFAISGDSLSVIVATIQGHSLLIFDPAIRACVNYTVIGYLINLMM